MKKTTFVILPIVALALSSCAKTAKYPCDHVGLYDTKLRQYIDIGASRAEIEKVFGEGEQEINEFNSESIDYDDGLTVWYDENDNLNRLSLYHVWGFKDEDPKHYELNGLSCENTVTDFIDDFQYIYEVNDPEYSIYNIIATYIEKTSDGFRYLSKEDLIKERMQSKSPLDTRTIYEISIEYKSYDDIQYINIDTVNTLYRDWSEYLSDNLK